MSIIIIFTHLRFPRESPPPTPNGPVSLCRGSLRASVFGWGEGRSAVLQWVNGMREPGVLWYLVWRRVVWRWECSVAMRSASFFQCCAVAWKLCVPLISLFGTIENSFVEFPLSRRQVLLRLIPSFHSIPSNEEWLISKAALNQISRASAIWMWKLKM